MKERIQFLFMYFIFWTVYYIAARIIFLTYHIQETKIMTLEQLWGTFLNGIRMDMSMAAFYSIIPFLLVAASPWLRKSIFERTLFSYTFIIVGLTTLLCVIDLEVYNVWSYRLDKTPLYYLESPKEAWASAKASPLFRLFLSFLLLYFLASVIIYRIIARKISTWKHIKRTPFVSFTLLITAALVFPIRGGLGPYKLKPSSVYFSDSNFANIAALNAPWNFIHSLNKGESIGTNPFTYYPKEIITDALDYLFSRPSKSQKVISSSPAKTNVLLITWKNLSTKVIDLKVDSLEVVPYLNQLMNEGFYFSNFYALGDRTDKALVALLSGYPSTPNQSIFAEEDKLEKLNYLSQDLSNAGWQTEFYYGGETDFVDMNQYLAHANFKNIYDINSFPLDANQNLWGVHDNVIFDTFLEKHKRKSAKPFFATMLTLSSTPPYQVPGDLLLTESNETYRYYNALHYADTSLKKFIEKAKTQAWWQNTLVIITGDHGSRMPQSKSRLEDFKIPMLWTGGALKIKGVSKAAYGQLDLPATLKTQLGFDTNKYGWSKDMFNTNTKQWAYFNFNNGFGYIENEEGFIYDTVGNKIISSFGSISEDKVKVGKALQQSSFDAYLDL